MMKYPMVEIRRDEPMKCTNTNRNVRRMIAPKPGVYARPQANAVRRRKKERRYVKDGSGRCHVFLVSVGRQ